MNFENKVFKKLQREDILKPFDCGDPDLNGFLIDDAHDFQEELLAMTYILKENEKIMAYVSLLNDKISIHDFRALATLKGITDPKELKKFWFDFKTTIFQDNHKLISSYPAMKIGRLGVSTIYERQGIGSWMLNALKYLFITNNRTGCRFITVDAYSKAIPFYKQNGFDFLTEFDNRKKAKTRLMFFDLKSLVIE